MRLFYGFLFLTASLSSFAVENIILEAENGNFDTSQVEIVSRKNLSAGKGIAIKARGGSDFEDKYHLKYTFNIPKDGRYELQSRAAVSVSKQPGMSKETFLYLKLDNELPRKRKVISPWKNLNNCIEYLRKFDLAAGEHYIEIWLPENVILDSLTLSPYFLPEVPENVKNYQPSILPPASHPRILVTKEIIPLIIKRLGLSGNREIWESLRKNTAASFPVDYNSLSTDSINYELLNNALGNAFIYLIENDKTRGRTAVELISKYIPILDFGNQLDICRKAGEVIFTASLIYDWCYDLSTADEKKILIANMLRLAENMEIQWPPFNQAVTIGHGNEAQVSRDLLSMSIAIYDENPEPYRICAYRILEELVPYKNFEYRSGRHSQGVSYGPYRFSWDLYAAWIFRRMSGKEIFSSDIKKVPYFWLYMRTPNGELLRDGDGGGKEKYWITIDSIFLAYTYCHDPFLKGEFLRQSVEFLRRKGTEYPFTLFCKDSIMFLLLNDPDLKAEENLDSLPLTRFFDSPLASMICRTGWNFDSSSPDVIVEMKAGGCLYSNHQHLDAGSFQIYYRGLLAADLGRYNFYGTPYDRNFNKRSIAHNLMLVYDPDENILQRQQLKIINDGGQRLINTVPTSLEQVLRDGDFQNASLLAHDLGPDKKTPLYSYLKCDLKSAYSDKVKSYIRSFCFLNLGIPHYPAALIAFDRLATKKAEYKKYWQINSYKKPLISGNVIEISNDKYGISGKLFVYPLVPEPDDLEFSTIGGENLAAAFGNKIEIPYQWWKSGWRTSISPKHAVCENSFLNVMVISDDDKPKLIPEKISASDNVAGVLIADSIVCFSKTPSLIASSCCIKVPAACPEYKLLFCDLMPGKWLIRRTDSGIETARADVLSENGTLFVSLMPGEYIFSRENEPNVK